MTIRLYFLHVIEGEEEEEAPKSIQTRKELAIILLIYEEEISRLHLKIGTHQRCAPTGI
jgi:hypothetical protein